MATLYLSDAPPSYEAATSSSAASTTPTRLSTDISRSSSPIPHRNGIPPSHRRSMEDEHRPLPAGWIRQFDVQEQHQFFVDTAKDPPRSTWLHPYDDPDYLDTLSPEERERHRRLHRSVTLDDVAAESSDEEDGHGQTTAPAASKSASATSNQPRGLHKYTRKMKDALTSSTHDQREAQRRQRAEQEQKAYAAHLRARQAMIRALETGEPQLLGKDSQGREVYIEPPPRGYGRVGGVGLGGGGFGGGARGLPVGAYGYNPYTMGPYANGNVRFMRPQGPYARPYGRGYGGGLGAPVAAGVLGGALMGGLLF